MPKTKIMVAAVLGLLLLLIYSDLQAATAELPAMQDTTLYEDDAGRLGNGAGQYLFIGKTWDQNGIDDLLRRAVFKFDLSGIPGGSTITAASFSFVIDNVPPGATPATISLHSLSDSWGEGSSNAPGAEGRGALAKENDATWLHRFFDDETWATPGGDFDLEPLQTMPISSSPQPVEFESSPELVAQVQSWRDNPDANLGWILLGDEIFVRNARRILSREHAGPGNPLLRVEYTPPPPVSVPIFTFAGLMVLFFMMFYFGGKFLPARLQDEANIS